MKWVGKYSMLFFLVLATGSKLVAQSDQDVQPTSEADSSNSVSSAYPDETVFTIREIFIAGNKKTRNSVVLREIPFQVGDKIMKQDLSSKLEDARRLLMNTVLFLEVVVAPKKFDGNFIDVQITVKERWYIFPVPYFKIVDRNMNQWLVEQKGKLSRTNYGLNVYYNNFTGRNDKLSLLVLEGYTKQISFRYSRPYIDRKMQWGISLGVTAGMNREVNYNTVNDKQVFFKDDAHFARSFFRASGELTYRKAIYTQHRFGIAFTSEQVDDSVVALNPSYFKDGRNKIVFPEIYYTFNYTNVDYVPYPLKGYIAEVSFLKRGINSETNLWKASAKVSGSWQITKKTYFGVRAAGMLKFPFRQPYYNQQLLGYNDFFMQGYEYYVVDGAAGGYLKATYSRELLNVKFTIKKKKDELPTRIPLRIYSKIYTNVGYSYNPTPGTSTLNNKMLSSMGVGIDIITYYDFTIKLEWSFNQLGQNGLFLHRKTLY